MDHKKLRVRGSWQRNVKATPTDGRAYYYFFSPIPSDYYALCVFHFILILNGVCKSDDNRTGSVTEDRRETDRRDYAYRLNTSVSHPTGWVFHLFPVVVLGHGSLRMAPPFPLKKVHVTHLMWVFICLKKSSLKVYPFSLDRRRTWESSDFACRHLGDTSGLDARSLAAMRRHTTLTTALVCCFANDCSWVMDKRLAASTTFRGRGGGGRTATGKKCRAQTWY